MDGTLESYWRKGSLFTAIAFWMLVYGMESIIYAQMETVMTGKKNYEMPIKIFR